MDILLTELQDQKFKCYFTQFSTFNLDVSSLQASAAKDSAAVDDTKLPAQVHRPLISLDHL